MKYAEVRKGAVAGAGALAQVVSLGFLHGTVLHWSVAALAVATAAGVYRVPNDKPNPYINGV